MSWPVHSSFLNPMGHCKSHTPCNVLQDVVVQVVHGTSHILEQEQAALMCQADSCIMGDRHHLNHSLWKVLIVIQQTLR